jgi:hypothetical protein
MFKKGKEYECRTDNLQYFTEGEVYHCPNDSFLEDDYGLSSQPEQTQFIEYNPNALRLIEIEAQDMIVGRTYYIEWSSYWATFYKKEQGFEHGAFYAMFRDSSQGNHGNPSFGCTVYKLSDDKGV